MDIKKSENVRTNNENFGQDSELEETQEKSIDPLRDVKDEIRIKEEELDIKEEYSENGQLIVLMREKFCPNTDFEEEIEIKNEPLDINEEYTENGQHFDQICPLNQSQIQIDGEKNEKLKVKSRSESDSSRKDQRTENKDLKNDCDLESKDEELELHLKPHITVSSSFSLATLREHFKSEMEACHFLQEKNIIPKIKKCKNNHEMKLFCKGGNKIVWLCSKKICRYNISVRKGTWFEGTKLEFRTIILFIYCWCKEETSVKFCKEQFNISKPATVDYNSFLREINKKKKDWRPRKYVGCFVHLLDDQRYQLYHLFNVILDRGTKEMVSRLEDLCGIQMAIELANKLEFKKEILRLPDLDLDRSLLYDGNKLWFENMEKKALDSLEKLPFGLRGKIPIPVVIFCLSQSMEWAKLLNEEFDLPFDYSCSFLRSSFFTSKGILNKEMAAREILKDTELSPSLKFCIACHYCVSDVIPVLWEQLPGDKRLKRHKNGEYDEYDLGISGYNEMVDLWSHYLLGKSQFIMKECDSFTFYKFKKSFKYKNWNDVAFKKCFEELNELERKEAVIFCRDELNYFLISMKSFGSIGSDTTPDFISLQLFVPFQPCIEIIIFLLHHLDERQLMVFFQPDILYYFLFYLLSWPYQHMFMNIVSQFWEVLPKNKFFLLLFKIVTLIKNKSSSKLCDYHNILRDFWIQSPSYLKRFFFHFETIDEFYVTNLLIEVMEHECFKFYVHSDFENFQSWHIICHLFISPFTLEDEKFVRLIFESATLDYKSDIVIRGNVIGNIAFEACDLRRIDLFIECCVPKEEIESFKKGLFNDEHAKEVLLFLVLEGKGKELQKILNWAFSAEEKKEWLKIFLLYLRRKWKSYLYRAKEKCFDKGLEWVMLSNEIEDFKSSVSSVEDIAHYYRRSLLKGDFQDVDLCLKCLFSSEIEILKCKKDLAFETIRHMDDSFLSEGLSLLKELIKWSSLSKEESKDFKRQVAFSEKVIEYYSNLVAQKQLDKADKFIQWTELTEMEVKSFKKLLVSNKEKNVVSACVSKRKPESSLQINSKETKRSRHC